MEASNGNGTCRDPRMTIQRVPDVPFAQIANSALRDKRLSFKARGILAMVLSHSGEWAAGRDWIERQSDQDGRDAIQSALAELTEHGYRRVMKAHVDGHVRTVVQWYQEPLTDALDGDDSRIRERRVFRPSGNLTVRKPDRQESRPSSEHNFSEHNQEQNTRNNSTAADAAFTEFWQTYPRRTAKGAAVKAFRQALKKASADTIIAGAARYRDDPNRDDAYTAHPATWLNAERWDDDPLPTPTAPVSAAQARANTARREIDEWIKQRETQ